MGMKLLIAGIGNILMKDEGVGVYQARSFSKKKIKGIEVVEIGTETWKIPLEAENFENLLIIDAVKFGNHPGTVYFIKNFELDDLPSFSLHQKDFIKELFLIKELKGKPENMYLFGIEPESIEWGIGLSPSLEKKFEEIQEKLERACFMILKEKE